MKIYDMGIPSTGTGYFSEKTTEITDDHLHQCMVEEIVFEGASLRWCNCRLEQPATVEVECNEEFVELHYNIAGESSSYLGGDNFRLQPLSHSIFYSNGYAGFHQVEGDKNKSHTFMEIKLSGSLFERLNSGMDSPANIILDCMANRKTGWIGKTAPVSPEMSFAIASIRNCPYSGAMKRLYLESKLMELYLLQVNSLKGDERQFANILRGSDIEKIYEARSFIDHHYGEACSIIYIASIIGLNQQKLKTGFREVLCTTVFGYLSEVRMQEAKRMLLDEKKYVGEVASEVGYKNPHHFTVAFKKRFGFLPGKLRG